MYLNDYNEIGTLKHITGKPTGNRKLSIPLVLLLQLLQNFTKPHKLDTRYLFHKIYFNLFIYLSRKTEREVAMMVV